MWRRRSSYRWSVAAPATAGTLQVTFDAYDNAPPGCEIWSTNGDSAFGMDPPCSEAALGFYGGGGGSLPAGARVGIQTTAPPGIAINSAFVSPYDIYNLNNGQGWGGGSYYAGGGGQWTDGDPDEIDSGFSSSYWGFQMICGFSVCTQFRWHLFELDRADGDREPGARADRAGEQPLVSGRARCVESAG